MKKRAASLCIAVLLAVLLCCQAFAADIPRVDTPNYKVAYYAFDCFNMQDEEGRRSGYGYEMMQNLANYMQCTFTYVGYENSAEECVEMLRNGELDIYTAARLTPERQQEFAISRHPAITATTCMNVKAGNTKVVAGDYSTYEGLRIGLLRRHTYNEKFIQFAEEKGFNCTISYYETPTELTNALIDGEVDALVNSYIRTPEDEQTVENFGETPYYIMARKEDQALIDELDAAMDAMNIEHPNWRTELYNKYYGTASDNLELTAGEQALLAQMQSEGTVIRAVMNPDTNPYSWYEDGEARGIAADIFRATAEKLGLDYEIVPVEDRAEYASVLDAGEVDVCMDVGGYYADIDGCRYKTTDPYCTTTLSLVRRRGSSGKIRRVAVANSSISIKEILADSWPEAEVVLLNSNSQSVQMVLDGVADGALMMSYNAQKLARDDIQNRLSVDIVPGAVLELQMGVNANDDRDFYGLWEKTLKEVSASIGDEVVQSYLENNEIPSFAAYLYDNPTLLFLFVGAAFAVILLAALYCESVKSRNKQQKIAGELAEALAEAKEANDAKTNFFSKMSHDIRTPLNVVLGMTQIAQKYKNDPARLDSALNSITNEGNHLLVLINSILDVNQLEHGHVELQDAPFAPAEAVRSSVELLQPLADQKEQSLTVQCSDENCVVVGDENRFTQIMINIISNAIKYTDAGGRIEVRLDCLPENRCRFTCTDNGMGMSQEFLKHIFDDYARAEDSRISKIQGTGLGMSVVKGFTDLMKGTLKVESEEGKGSTFVVELPFAPATEEQRTTVLQAARTADLPDPALAGKRVLLAEDNALNAEIATELLSGLGLTVDWAEDGQQAVDKLERSAPGSYFAIFMDMQMPVMDGVTATRKIRASSHPDHGLPIFAMTANTFATDRRTCREAGMNGYISKPINTEAIAAAVKEAIE